jgi:predicted dehydrogenase
MDLVHSVTGLETEAVFADLKTVHPVRKRPKGEVQTYTGKTQAPMQTEPVSITTEDYGAVLFRFKGGARGSLYVSQVTAGKKNCLRYEISGSKCALGWNSEAPNEMWIGRRGDKNQSLVRDPSLLSDIARHFSTYPGGHNEGFPDAFKGCFRAFYEYIAKGDMGAAPLYPTFADGHHSIALCDAILKSHREQRWINVH